MNDHNIIELIHRDLDHELDPGEKQKLMDLLKHNPEAEAYYRDWQYIQSGLEENRELAPEISLTKEILNRIPMEAQTTHKPEPLIRVSFWNRPAFRYSVIFIAGVFLGFLAFTFLMPARETTRPASEQLKGSFYDSRTFDQMTTADNLFFENPMVKASFDVRYSTSIVEIRVSLSSLYPVQGLIMFDYNSLQPMNVVNLSVNDQSTIMAASNYVQINNAGSNQYVIQLLNKNSLPQQVSIKIVQNDVPIYQNAVTVNKD